MNRADGKDFLETQLGKFIGVSFGAARVHLVGGDQNGFAAAAQAAGNFAVERHDAFLHVDDQHDDIRRFDGQFHLFERGLDDDVAGFFAAQQTDAAGVHEREGVPAPLGLGGDAVARDAGLVMHDGDAPSDDAIEQRGLADIRPADNGDQA